MRDGPQREEATHEGIGGGRAGRDGFGRLRKRAIDRAQGPAWRPAATVAHHQCVPDDAARSTPTQTAPDIEAQESARRTLYRMAEGECAILSETFQMECRLASLQMFAPAIGPAATWNVMTATGVYELRPRRADP